MGQAVCRFGPATKASDSLYPIDCVFAPWKVVSDVVEENKKKESLAFNITTVIILYLLLILCFLTRKNKLLSSYVFVTVIPMLCRVQWAIYMIFERQNRKRAPLKVSGVISRYAGLNEMITQTLLKICNIHLSTASFLFLILYMFLLKSQGTKGFLVTRFPFLLHLLVCIVFGVLTDFDIAPPLRGFVNPLVPVALCCTFLLIFSNAILTIVRRTRNSKYHCETFDYLISPCVFFALLPSFAFLFVKDIPNYVRMDQSNYLMLMCHSCLPEFLQIIQPIVFSLSILPLMLIVAVYKKETSSSSTHMETSSSQMQMPPIIVSKITVPAQIEIPRRNEYDPNLVAYLMRPSVPPSPYVASLLGFHALIAKAPPEYHLKRNRVIPQESLTAESSINRLRVMSHPTILLSRNY